MSKIPYFFETPIPKYFRETGWFDNPNSILFITWAFSKCSTERHKTVHDFTELTLEPYEFVTGLGKGCQESLLSEGAFKHQLKMLSKAGLLKKTTNSRANRFTAYIWITDRFSKDNNQLNARLTTNSQPTEQPQSREEILRSKEDHHPDPSSSNQDSVDVPDDDTFQPKGKATPSEKREIYPKVWLTQSEIDECISFRGSMDSVINIIRQVLDWPDRKGTIKNWSRTILTWNPKNKTKESIQSNEAHGKILCETYWKFSSSGWRCMPHRCNIKDLKGILFESQMSAGMENAIFIDFSDQNFKQKCDKLLTDKGLRD